MINLGQGIGAVKAPFFAGNFLGILRRAVGSSSPAYRWGGGFDPWFKRNNAHRLKYCVAGKGRK